MMTRESKRKPGDVVYVDQRPCLVLNDYGDACRVVELPTPRQVAAEDVYDSDADDPAEV